MNRTEIEECERSEVIYVQDATASILAQFLDPVIPWIWILGHCPHRYYQWFESKIPLNNRGSVFSGLVRDAVYDLQMSTAEFLNRVQDFDAHGLVLIQSEKQMPDTLCLARIPESQQDEILIQNGATMRMYLPHAVETAQVQSFMRGYLSSVINRLQQDSKE